MDSDFGLPLLPLLPLFHLLLLPPPLRFGLSRRFTHGVVDSPALRALRPAPHASQDVRPGESPDPEDPDKWGTATLRMCVPALPLLSLLPAPRCPATVRQTPNPVRGQAYSWVCASEHLLPSALRLWSSLAFVNPFFYPFLITYCSRSRSRYVQKNKHGVKMLKSGITFCLVFNSRSLDLGADSVRRGGAVRTRQA